MGNENTVRKAQRGGTNRKKLSEITNTPFRLHGNFEVSIEAQLQKDLAASKKLLQEKDELIAENKRYMEKLLIKYCQKTKQNDEIILHNAQLFKELMQARDKLKVLQHENTQMSAVHKAYKLEIEKKLAEAMEQSHRSGAQLRTQGDVECFEESPHSRPGDINRNKTLGPLCKDFSAATCKSNVRKRESKSSHRQSTKMKTSQTEGQYVKTSREFVSSQDESKATRSDGPPKQCENVDGHGLVLSVESISPDVKMHSRDKIISEGQMGLEAKLISEDTTIIKPSSNGEMSSEDKMITKLSSNGVINVQPITLGQKARDETEELLQRFDTLNISMRRQSGRPQRRAVSSIGSYREPPLNIKMRRPL